MFPTKHNLPSSQEIINAHANTIAQLKNAFNETNRKYTSVVNNLTSELRLKSGAFDSLKFEISQKDNQLVNFSSTVDALNVQLRAKDKLIKDYSSLVTDNNADILNKGTLIETLKSDILVKDDQLKEYLDMVNSLNPSLIQKVEYIRGDNKKKPEQSKSAIKEKKKKDKKKKRSFGMNFCSNPGMESSEEVVVAVVP